MKHFIAFLLVFSALTSRAQITLEHTYPFRLMQFVLVDTNDTKFFRLHADTLDIFNPNHTLYKTIPLPKVGNVQYYTKIQYVSRRLFDLDNKIEFLAETSPRNAFVFNEDGLMVFECDKCSPNYPLANGGDALSESVVTTENGSKLFLTDSLFNTLVYSLPGKLPGCTTKSSVESPSIISSGSSLPTSAYPNPSNGQIRIEYQLPDGVATGEIVIMNLQGIEVRKYQVGNIFNYILVERSDLPSGNYFYKLVTGKGESEMKKIIVAK
jgi:hypothetical protein